MHTSLPLRHFLLGLAVVAVWGTNFVVIKLALGQMPPLLFATLRFAAATLPAILWLPRPAVSWANLAAYGLLIGVGQFGLMFVAINGHISPGLASLVVQMQVFFTIGLAMLLSGERARPVQGLALVLAAGGLGVIFSNTDGSASPWGLGLMLLAALSWAGGNMVSRAAGRVNMLAYVVWSSAFAVPPLLLLTLGLEGWGPVRTALQQADALAWSAVLWQAVANSLFGYAAWGWLLARYPAATVTPLALLVPVFGMGGSALWLGEGLPAWKLLAAAMVVGALALNLLWPRLQNGARRFRLARALAQKR